MNRTKAFVLLMFILLGAACVVQTESVPTDPSTRVAQTESMHTDPSAFQNWQFVEPQLPDQTELPVIVYAIKVSPGETLLITSFTADEAKKLDEASINVQIRDDLASASLVNKYDLGTIGQVSFLVLRFAPRSVGAGELYLHINQGAQNTNSMDRLIARFSDPPESSTLHNLGTYRIQTSQTYEQEGYRISFAGWFIPPLPVTFSTPEPPAGVTINYRATLEIIEISSNQTTYLYIQLLSDGGIKRGNDQMIDNDLLRARFLTAAVAVCGFLMIIKGVGLASNSVNVARASSPEIATLSATVSEFIGQQNSSGRSSYPLLPLSTPQPIWQRLDFPMMPPPRIGSAFILNPINQLGLLFGGFNSSMGDLNDLWLTNGLSWMQFSTPHSPGIRRAANVAYDELHQQALLYGGMNGITLLGDTWLFNGVDWIQQNPPVSPAPRSYASMAYDVERNITILFGGQADAGGEYWEPLNEMWAWNGETWQQLFPAVLPPARMGASIVYDRARKSIVLFGGGSGGGLLEDTWLWDGSAWIEQQPQHHPVGRANFGMAYDESSQLVILFGGQADPYADRTETWAWDGQDWTQLLTFQTPPVELAYCAQLVYLPNLQSIMLYNTFREKTIDPGGGFTFSEHSEAWVLAYSDLIYLPLVSK